jgi:hypothetical protein
MTATRFLTRAEQVEYLASRGIPVTKLTLGKLASTGGGPRYVIFGSRALSTAEWLDEWVAARMKAPRHSTSEAA